MAIAKDAVSNPTPGTGALSWTHTPSGTPRSALVFVCEAASNTDGVTGVTYGGNAMSEVALSPSLPASSVEEAVVHAFFLDNVPSGAQTVAVSVSGTITRAAVCYTQTASAAVEVEDTSVNASATIGTTPSVALTTGAGVETIGYAMFWSARGAVGNVTPDAGMSTDYEFDFTPEIVDVSSLDSNDAGGGFTMSWTTSGEDEGNILAVALKESTGAAAYELDAQPGSFTLTGADAGLPAGRVLSANPGAFALTGAAAGVLADRVLDAAFGTFSLIGFDAGLPAGRVIDASPGAFTLTGTDAGLLAARVLDAQPGAFTLTGFDAAIVAARLLSADPAVFVLTGFDADLDYGQPGAYELNAEPGAFVLAGAAAGILAGRAIEAEPGVFVLSGADAGVIADRVIVADPGVFVLTGAAAGLDATGQAVLLDAIATGRIAGPWTGGVERPGGQVADTVAGVVEEDATE